RVSGQLQEHDHGPAAVLSERHRAGWEAGSARVTNSLGLQASGYRRQATEPKPTPSPRCPRDPWVEPVARLTVCLGGRLVTMHGETLRDGIRTLLESKAPGRYWVAELNGRVVGQLLITFEWSDWRNRMVWWIQSVYVLPDVRRTGVFRALFDHVRDEARRAGSGGLRLYVDTSNAKAQAVYKALGMNGDHYHVFEDMFAEE